MDFRNVTAGKLYDSATSIIRGNGFNQNCDAVRARSGQGFDHINHFIAADLETEWIGQLAIRRHQLHFSKLRFEAYSPISFI